METVSGHLRPPHRLDAALESDQSRGQHDSESQQPADQIQKKRKEETYSDVTSGHCQQVQQAVHIHQYPPDLQRLPRDHQSDPKTLSVRQPDLHCLPSQPSYQESVELQSGRPHGITMIHLKHLGPRDLQFLTELFNTSISRSQIPAIWKTSIVLPLLKPGKPADESASYRPISFFCPAVKILEK